MFTLVALGVLGRMLWETAPADRFQGGAIGLVASGALGNAVDRAWRGTVTDFVRVHVADPAWVERLRGWPLVGPALCGRQSCDWPAFNVADMAIVGGLALFALVLLRPGAREPVAEEPEAKAEA